MPRIEILTIGDELVEGRLVDSNAGELSAMLVDLGLPVAAHASVGDDLDEMVRALREAAGRSDAVLVSGGLGPTSDDLTAVAAAEAFGLGVVRSPEALEHTRSFFADRRRAMAPSNEKQADLPAGSAILPNPEGTAVGFRLDAGSCRLYFLPGVPRELRRMAAESVLPDLVRRLDAAPPLVKTLKLFGRGESDVAQDLLGLEDAVADGVRLTVQYRASFPEIHLRLVLRDGERPATPEMLEALSDNARRRLGHHVFAVGGATLDTDFPAHAAAVLAERGLTLAAAEVASAGRLDDLLALAGGGARCLAGGLVAPSEAVLAEQLGLDTTDAETVARAVRVRFGADLGVAVLGSAAGGASRPPGTLVIAAATAKASVCRELRFPIDADRFQLLAAYGGLRLALRLVADEPA